MQNHSRNGDLGFAGKPVFVLLQRRINRRIGLPGSIAVQRCCDPIGVVEGLRGDGKLRVGELPLGRPRLPAFTGQCFPVSLKFDLSQRHVQEPAIPALADHPDVGGAPSHSFRGSGWCTRWRTPERRRALFSDIR